MRKKNRIEQPYGYREQNKFTSEPFMICEAITNGGGSGEDKIIDKVNELLRKSFVAARYENEKLIFTNSYNADVDSVDFPFIVDTATFDNESNKIIITFKDDSVQPIEIPLDELLSKVASMINDEAVERENADSEIWEVLGEIGTSGSSIIELITNEESARTNSDEELWSALNEEISNRTTADEFISSAITDEASSRENEDERLWEAINNFNTSGESIIELINNEVSARTVGDSNLWDVINQEVVDRQNADSEIWGAIGEIGVSGSSIVEIINQEVFDRTSSDEELWDALNNEISARTANDNVEESYRIDGDNALNDKISNEKAARLYWDNALSGVIETEKINRETEDSNLRDSINLEVSARTQQYDELNTKINQEIINRATADGALDGRIDGEISAREGAFNELDSKINSEKTDRIDGDNALSALINNEKANRESEDLRIWEALSAETIARINGDESLGRLIESNEVSIVKVRTSLPSNVKEAYELKNNTGEVLGDRINIYKDSSLRDVKVTDHDNSGHTGQFLEFTYILDDGSEKLEYVDVSQFLVEAEFRDGFMVNSAGEVKVKVDTSSEDYLTVSPNGVKLSGIDSIAQNLSNETINRQNADTLLETSLTNEITARQTAVNTLNDMITAETYTRETSDNDLNSRLSREISDRISSDSGLTAQIYAESTYRENSDILLNRHIENVDSNLSAETESRVAADNLLQIQINDLKNKELEDRNSIAQLNDGLDTEISSREESYNVLMIEIGKKANSLDVYYRDECNERFALKSEIPSDFYSKVEVDEKDNEIKSMITSEEHSRSEEDVALYRMITAETLNRENADNEIRTNISSIEDELSNKVVSVSSSSSSIGVDNSDPINPSIKLNISSENGQNIKLNNDGIYSKASLEYDEENNVLSFTNTVGTTSFTLKTRSQIDNIYYDKPNEEIVIEYTVNGQRKEDVRVPVSDLIEEWRTEDGNVGAIELTKERNTSSEDVLKARLILNTTHDDNAAIIDDNALYVSKNAIVSEVNAEIEALKARVAALENALQVATQEHTSQSHRITQVEETNTNQDQSINDLLNYININTEG